MKYMDFTHFEPAQELNLVLWPSVLVTHKDVFVDVTRLQTLLKQNNPFF